MPRTAKKTSRTTSKAATKKSGTKSATARKRKPASSSAGRSSNAKGRATKKRGSSAAKSRGVRSARGQRRGGAASKPLKYSKWIDTPEQHEDRPGQSLATRSHDVIRQWADARQAVPASVESTERGGTAGVLRLNFPGYGGQRLQEVTWEDWFETFDQRNLVFLYQEHKTDGSMSNFFRLSNADN